MGRRSAGFLARAQTSAETRSVMIRSVRIQGFKSLADVRVDLGRFNVFVGPNGCGKTNLLEAIGVVGCAAAGRVDDSAFIWRGVRPGLPALFKTAFHRQKIRRLISITVSGDDGAKYSVALDNPISNPKSAWRIANETFKSQGRTVGSRSPAGGSVRGAGKDLDLSSQRGLGPVVSATNAGSAIEGLLLELDEFGIYTPFTPMLRGTAPDGSPRTPLGLSGGGLADATRQMLREHRHRLPELRKIYPLIEWADAFKVGTAAAAQLSPAVATTRNVLRFRDRHMRDRRDWISAFDASEGALYVMFLALLVLHPESPPVVAVDNIDTALNPRLARGLLGLIQELVAGDVSLPQVLLTTHSPLCLDSLPLADEAVRLFIVDRSRSGATVVTRVQHTDALAKAAERGMTLSQLWLSGALGGMPNL